jgi:6-phosphogluconolactonase
MGAAARSRERMYDGGMERRPDVTVLADATRIADEAAHRIVRIATDAVGARGRFMVALAGGATPRATYAQLSLPPFVEQMPWEQTWVFFGDERAVPPEHPESNYRMASDTLLAKVPVPAAQVFRMQGEAEDLDAAAVDYARLLATAFGTRRGEVPRFDLVLLGIGIDGHVASLFPGSPVVKEIFRPVVAVHAAAAAIPDRLTLTLPVLTNAAHVLFLASGAEKARAVKAALADGALLPASMVVPADGRLEWILDRAAASRLPGHRR